MTHALCELNGRRQYQWSKYQYKYRYQWSKYQLQYQYKWSKNRYKYQYQWFKYQYQEDVDGINQEVDSIYTKIL